jgi:hypothetical protein
VTGQPVPLVISSPALYVDQAFGLRFTRALESNMPNKLWRANPSANLQIYRLRLLSK